MNLVNASQDRFGASCWVNRPDVAHHAQIRVGESIQLNQVTALTFSRPALPVMGQTRCAFQSSKRRLARQIARPSAVWYTTLIERCAISVDGSPARRLLKAGAAAPPFTPTMLPSRRFLLSESEGVLT